MINHLKFLTAGAALIAAVLSGPAQPIQSRQAKFSALTIVINFQQLSLAYETLTFMTEGLQNVNGQSDPAAIVALYNNVTNTELGAQAIPQPSSPIDDYDQYGVLSAYLSLTESDRAFLNALIMNKQFFSANQKATVRGILEKQIALGNTLNHDIAGLAPDVLTAVEAITQVLESTSQDVLKAFV